MQESLVINQFVIEKCDEGKEGRPGLLKRAGGRCESAHRACE